PFSWKATAPRRERWQKNLLLFDQVVEPPEDSAPPHEPSGHSQRSLSVRHALHRYVMRICTTGTPRNHIERPVRYPVSGILENPDIRPPSRNSLVWVL